MKFENEHVVADDWTPAPSLEERKVKALEEIAEVIGILPAVLGVLIGLLILIAGSQLYSIFF